MPLNKQVGLIRSLKSIMLISIVLDVEHVKTPNKLIKHRVQILGAGNFGDKFVESVTRVIFLGLKVWNRKKSSHCTSDIRSRLIAFFHKERVLNGKQWDRIINTTQNLVLSDKAQCQLVKTELSKSTIKINKSPKNKGYI